MNQPANLAIVDYNPEYQTAFRTLNEEWIKAYFRMEESDFLALDHPMEYIIKKGGHILVVLSGSQPVAVCALLKMEDPAYQYELAKMAVTPELRGRHIGLLLGNAIVAKARELGARKIYLETNDRLQNAIALYKKLGFTYITGRSSPYERSNVQMELVLH